jgi:hypothetical protein
MKAKFEVTAGAVRALAVGSGTIPEDQLVHKDDAYEVEATVGENIPLKYIIKDGSLHETDFNVVVEGVNESAATLKTDGRFAVKKNDEQPFHKDMKDNTDQSVELKVNDVVVLTQNVYDDHSFFQLKLLSLE